MEFTEAEVRGVRRPTASSAVRKTECAYSFDTPESPGGLLVCLSCFLGVSPAHAPLHHRKTTHALYLSLRRVRRLKRSAAEPAEPPLKRAAPTVLGIGVEGGFESGAVGAERYEWDERREVVRVPSMQSVPLEHPCVPREVLDAALDVIAAESSEKKEDVAAWRDEEKVKVSTHAAGLVQLDNGVRVPPSGWRCQHPGCAFEENLWLNLSDGSVLCGRANFLGLGNEHAYKHYVETGRKFPLAVKLGTVTGDAADVYSYAEDNMVADPLLDKHLAHWGLDRAAMSKTDKSMAELSIDLNQRYEFSRLTESDKKLVPVFGPGHTGLKNLGNTCYLAAAMQVLFSLPEFVDSYAREAENIFQSAPSDPTSNFLAQLAKLGDGLASGKYSIPVQPVEGEEPPAEQHQEGIPPRAFKAVVGRSHPNFATKQQQDSAEFLMALFTEIEKAERGRGRADPSRLFQFRVEERHVCGASGRVRYSHRAESMLTLQIPVERATNLAEVAAYELSKAMAADKATAAQMEPVRYVVPLAACIDLLKADETIEGFASPIGVRTTAAKRSRLASFPPVLLVQLCRYTVGPDWQPKKLDALVEMPEVLDLSELRAAGGPQAGELPLDDPAVAVAAPPAQQAGKPKPDPNIVSQLVMMGFPSGKAERAAVETGNKNLDTAMEWLLARLDDPEEPAAQTAAAVAVPDASAEVIETLCSMGFTEAQVRKALANTANDSERAADWLLSHADAMDEDVPMPPASPAAAWKAPVFAPNTDSSRYELVGFISHMGKSTQSGHYVAHIRKGGKWVLFNDEKVAISESPPRDMGYLYFYRRV